MQLRNYAGWTRESGMPAVYLHPEQKDTEKKLLKLRGIEVEESVPEPVMSTKKCSRCGANNSFDAKFCKGCSIILDTKLAIEKQEAEEAEEAAKMEKMKAELSIEFDEKYKKDMFKLVWDMVKNQNKPPEKAKSVLENMDDADLQELTDDDFQEIIDDDELTADGKKE
jgi:ribosomal protein L40E